MPEVPAATFRNRVPIRDALEPRLPLTGLVLEVASGNGLHAATFAVAFPGLRFLPTDGDPEAVETIAANVEEMAPLPNLLPPLLLDASAPSWPVEQCEVVYCANMIHIAPWSATVGLFAGVGRVLAPGGALFTYGPYLVDGQPTTDSNAAFDASLRARNPAWGLRDLADLDVLAREAGLSREETLPMPANNFLLVFRRAKA